MDFAQTNGLSMIGSDDFVTEEALAGYVTLATAQTITGAKTFTDEIVGTSNIDISGTGNNIINSTSGSNEIQIATVPKITVNNLATSISNLDINIACGGGGTTTLLVGTTPQLAVRSGEVEMIIGGNINFATDGSNTTLSNGSNNLYATAINYLSSTRISGTGNLIESSGALGDNVMSVTTGTNQIGSAGTGKNVLATNSGNNSITSTSGKNILNSTSGSNEIQIATVPKITVASASTILSNTAHTINGVTTFDVPPISAVAPTTANQLTNKTYVDLRALDTTVVHRTGGLTESINGDKTFTGSTLMSGKFDVTNALQNDFTLSRNGIGFRIDAQGTALAPTAVSIATTYGDITIASSNAGDILLKASLGGTNKIEANSTTGSNEITTNGTSASANKIENTGTGGNFIQTASGKNVLNSSSGSNEIQVATVAKITTSSTTTLMRNKRNSRISDGTSINAYVPATANGNIYDSAQSQYTVYIGDATTNISPAIYTSTQNYYQNGAMLFYSTDVGTVSILFQTLGANADINLLCTNATNIKVAGETRIRADTVNNSLISTAGGGNYLQVGTDYKLSTTATDTNLTNKNNLFTSNVNAGSNRLLATTGAASYNEMTATTNYINSTDQFYLGAGSPNATKIQISSTVNTFTNVNGTYIITTNGTGGVFRVDVGTKILQWYFDGLYLSNLAGAGTRGVSVTAGGIIIVTPSDRRLKNNIEPIDATQTHLNILKLQPITYQWINQKKYGTETEIGMIAQDVMEHIPQLVWNDEKEDTYGIHYERIPTLLIQSVKELQRQIDELKEQNQKLSQTLNSIIEKIPLLNQGESPLESLDASLVVSD